MILIECPDTGEQCLVESAEGYPGWLVIAENVEPPLDQHYRWCKFDHCWKADPERRLRAENLAGIRDPEVLLAIIEDLLARVATLEAKEN